jgi:hypothetical protein
MVRKTGARQAAFTPHNKRKQPPKQHTSPRRRGRNKRQVQPEFIFVRIASLFQRREGEVVEP